MKSTELAWAAGFFDGEGSFYVLKRRKNSRRADSPRRAALGLRVTQADIRPLQRFANIFGLNVVGPYHRNDGPEAWNRKGFYVVQVTGSKAEQFAELLSRYLSDPKKEQLGRCLGQVHES